MNEQIFLTELMLHVFKELTLKHPLHGAFE